MNTITCDSFLNSFKIVKQGEDTFWMVQLKVVEETSIRTFPKQFGTDIDFRETFESCAANDTWDKVNFPVADFSLDYKLTFGDISFNATLVNISAIRKYNKKEDRWSTEYTLSLICDPEKEEIKRLMYYVKRKDVDPDTGKKVLVPFNTVLEEYENTDSEATTEITEI